MEIIIHRVNTVKKLKKIPTEFGAEIDLRSYKNKFILNHEPYADGDSLINYIKNYRHGTLVLNIKESGIENEVLRIVRTNKKIKNYFLLDVEVPYLFYCLKSKEKSVSLRISYYEPTTNLINFKNKFNWIWIDTIKKLNFNKKDITAINTFKKCLVCPERWGKANEIIKYYNYFKKNKIKLDAVMTSLKQAKVWKNLSN